MDCVTCQPEYTTSNINDLRNGVNLTELPRTIREAINLTTKLALKYIWVDVLCIIQDDKSDWEREAKKMGTIYENAYLTVAAACSSSSEQGFMLPQTEKMPFRVNLCDSNGNPVVIGMRKILRCGIHGSRSDPWHHRGWTLQEGLLSTRLVSYTSEELQWTCRTLSTCECGGSKPKVRQELPESLLHVSDPLLAFAMWGVHIWDYSRRFLTCPRDKLVAMDGIAQAVQRIVKCDYVAGLWSSNLLYGISWSRECGKDTMDMTLPPHVSHIEYRAPTWSWASVDGALGYYTPASGDSLISNAEIVSWDVRTFDDTQFGQVKDGSLQIRGHLIPGILNREPTEEDYNLGFRALEPDLIVEPNNGRLVPDVNLQILPYLDIDGKQA